MHMLKRSKSALIGFILVACMVFIGILGSALSPYDPYKIDLQHDMYPPSWEHPFGTDRLGRDILSRVLEGTRISLIVGLSAVFIALALGLPVGMISGYTGGWVDDMIMRVIDAFLAFPYVLVAMILIAIMGPGIQNTVFAVGLSSSPVFARLARANTLGIKKELYVTAAVATGEKGSDILLRYILPNSIQSIVVTATLRISSATLTVASLSFLGLGAMPPLAELGLMVTEGRNLLSVAPHISFFPGLMIGLVTLAFNLFGDGLNDLLNPKLRRKR